MAWTTAVVDRNCQLTLLDPGLCLSGCYFLFVMFNRKGSKIPASLVTSEAWLQWTSQTKQNMTLKKTEVGNNMTSQSLVVAKNRPEEKYLHG